jgi:hypothetical protein
MLEYIDVILLTCVRMDGFLGFFNERETGDLDLRRCQRVSFGTYIIREDFKNSYIPFQEV